MGEDAEKTELDTVIVSFYTDDEVYRPAGERLIASLKKFGLKHDVRCIQRFGDFHDHCFYKPQFLMEMLDLYETICWCDADNEFQEFPAMLGKIKTDIAVCRFTRWDWELSTTMLYLKSKENVKELLTAWDKANKSMARSWTADQFNFHLVLQWFIEKGKVTLSVFPPAYYQSVDSEVKVSPIVWQHQTSREGRAYVSSAA